MSDRDSDDMEIEPLMTATTADSSTSSYSYPSTPVQSGGGDETYRDHCNRSEKFSPPAKAEELSMKTAELVFNNLFEGSTSVPKWENVHEDKQAMFGYLVLKNQIERVKKVNSVEAAKSMTWNSLDKTTECGKRLFAFIRKGGDICEPKDPNDISIYQEFLEHGPWIDNSTDCPTIFNSQQGPLEPLMWYQEKTSKVFYIVASALAIYYRQCIDRGILVEQDHGFGVGDYAMNVSRFMRDNFTDDEIFQDIFGVGGGHPTLLIRRVLHPQNPQHADVTSIIDISLSKLPRKVFDDTSDCLVSKYGALIIADFKSFPSLWVDDGQLTYHGDWKTHAGPNPEGCCNHALLIVGVCLVEHLRNNYDGNPDFMGGVAFLLQNSCEQKPFLIVGLDFLRSMGIGYVVVVRRGLTFDASKFKHDNKTSVHKLQSGSRACTSTIAPQRVFQTPLPTPKDESGSSPKIWERVDSKASYKKT
jgi:hypothetical protein